ncbi:MAG: hypothetical protein WC091_20755 [Sulfuricellaceae bacterium]
MQAIEFEAVPEHHMIRVPDGIPDNVPLRVLLLLDTQDTAKTVARTTESRYETFAVDKILIPPRDQRYDR